MAVFILVDHNRSHERLRPVERFANCLVDFDVAEVARPITAIGMRGGGTGPTNHPKAWLGQVEANAAVGHHGMARGQENAPLAACHDAR